jgi:hypothetical protein
MIWFCILLAVVLQTCWLSPPVALSAYYIKGIMPEWELMDIYKGMMPFMASRGRGFGLSLPAAFALASQTSVRLKERWGRQIPIRPGRY